MSNFRRAVLGFLLLFLSSHPALAAQEGESSPWPVIGGGLLGAYSGATLGLLGGLEFCNRTLAGARCPRIAAALGGTLGLASGAGIGAEDADALYRRDSTLHNV